MDDDPLVAASLLRRLSTLYQVSTVPGATEALEVLKEERVFDVILCDVMMPGMTGVDFYRRLSDQGGSLHRKVIFMTGGVVSAGMNEFFAQVPNRCLEKPIDDQILAQALKDAVQMSAD